jgi:hypothetical protein
MNQVAAQAQPKRSGCGCLGMGCLVATILALLVGGGLTWFMVSSIRGAVKTYTTDQPVPVPTAQVDEATRTSAEQKFSDLREVLASPGGSGSFSFSGSELQALTLGDEIGKKISLDAREDALHASFSFSLSDFQNPAFDLLLSKELTQRFFNGSAVARLGATEGHLEVKFDELILNGRSLEGDALSQAGWFVGGAIESFLMSLVGANSSADTKEEGGSGRIAKAGVSGGVLRIDIGPAAR